MSDTGKIQVSLDTGLVKNLLNGLIRGAERKGLKAIIDAHYNFHIKSQELRVIIETDDAVLQITKISLYNEKESAVITSKSIEEMGLTQLSGQVVKELKEKYSPVAHSLADNIFVFARTYGGN